MFRKKTRKNYSVVCFEVVFSLLITFKVAFAQMVPKEPISTSNTTASCPPEEDHTPHPTPKHTFFIGPSIATRSGNGIFPSFTPGIDLTYGQSIFWGSAGVHLPGLGSSNREVQPYSEFGFWMGVNIGFGLSLNGLSSTNKSHLDPHLFLGTPFPVPVATSEKKETVIVLEPYYRPSISSEDSHFSHELGFLLKWGVLIKKESKFRKQTFVDGQCIPVSEVSAVNECCKTIH